MDKKFFQVFENLEIPKKLQELFEDVEVERIVVSKASKMVNVHIFSRHLINRNNIKSMESCINKQLFHNESFLSGKIVDGGIILYCAKEVKHKCGVFSNSAESTETGPAQAL